MFSGIRPIARVDDPVAYTIDEFCRAHKISRGTFYNLCRKGLGPKFMDLNGPMRRISGEAAAEWRRERTEAGE